MPLSKRSKVVPLTTKKKAGRVAKQNLVESVHQAMANYKHVYTFQYKNMRTNFFKEIRRDRHADSRFILGNNRVMMLALGRNEAESFEPNLHKMSSFLKGSSGLLFTNLDKPSAKKLFALSYVKPEFARAGALSSVDVTIHKGPLDQTRFPHSVLEELGKLGLPVILEKGIIKISDDYEVCCKGQTLTANQCQILKLFEYRTVEFRITLTAHWTNGVARKIST